MGHRIVLGYGGGFDVAAAVAWLEAQGAADVVAVTMDVGQAQPLEELRERALAAGAIRAHVLDARDAFAAGYVLPSLRADAVDEHGAPMPASLARALVADKLVEVARIEQADGVAHGAGTGDPDGAVLGRAIAAIDPALQRLVVPSPPAPSAAGDGRMGSNLWGRTMARDAALAPDGSARPLTSARAAAPAEAASVDIRFERGVPVSVNGVSMPLVELIGTIAHLAASQGVGSVVTGAAVVEAPAAIVLHAAHRALAGTTRSRERQRVARQYANIVASGEWATPARAKLDREVERLDEPLNGSVTVRLFRGQHELIIPSGSRA